MSETNWQVLSAGSELNRVIAERLRLFDDDGIAEGVPDYSRDANDAVALPIDVGAWLQIETASWASKTSARVALTVSSSSRLCNPPYETAETVALAVCRAWLAYQDRLESKT